MKKNSLLFSLCSAIVIIASLTPIDAGAAPGDLYVPDQTAGTILKFAPDGTQTSFASGLSAPVGSAFDGKGNLFVTESGANSISEFTPTGVKSTFASGLSGPVALAFDSAGNLFVTESGTNSILKFTPDGTKSTFVAGRSSPAGLAFDTAGNLLEADSGSGAIFKFTPDGLVSTVASGLSDPQGLAFDSVGNLFAADSGSGNIFQFAPDGTQSTFASGLTNPKGLAFDDSGNLFVTDAAGNISRITPDGISTVFASGLGSPGFAAFEPVAQRLRNISSRAFVQTGENVLIGGFIVGGNALVNNPVVARAIGPSLGSHGVANPLQDPTLELHDASGAVIAFNDNWQDTQATQITATGLAPTDPNESAILIALPAGNYTAIVRGVNDTTGVALVEVYNLQQ